MTSITSLIKFYHVTEIFLQMHLCDQSLVTLTFLGEISRLEFYKDVTRKRDFFAGLSQSNFSYLGLLHGLETLQQCCKRVKIKNQKFLRTISYFQRGYRRKTGMWSFLSPLPNHPHPEQGQSQRDYLDETVTAFKFASYKCFPKIFKLLIAETVLSLG